MAMMPNTLDAKAAEIDRNLAAFLKVLPQILNEHAGQYALIHDGEIIGYYSSALDAQIAGNQGFEPTKFSIQHVESLPAELGFHSYALHSR